MRSVPIIEKAPLKACSESLPKPDADAIAAILRGYGVSEIHSIELIDSSHDADDIRWNYIIDKKFVLRLCNAPDMTESRMEALNRLIDRYRAFGLRCPAFLKGENGSFFEQWEGLTAYLSDYIDLPIAAEAGLTDAEKDVLEKEIVLSLARFLERYRNIDLIPTMGMYSLFELCPYDVPLGIDEKQQNMDSLCKALGEIGETALAKKLSEKNEAVRAHLQPISRTLPRCVTQGDENLSNVLLGKDGKIAGLIDFNLAGTDVCVNLIANNADFGLYAKDDPEGPFDPDRMIENAIAEYRGEAKTLLSDYRATEQELAALPYYAWIVLVSQYPHVCMYRRWLRKEKIRACTLALLDRIAALDPKALMI